MDGVVDEVPLPAVVERAVAWHATVNDAELALALHHAFHQRSDALSPTLRERLQRAQDIRAVDYPVFRPSVRRGRMRACCGPHVR
ncbi:hypothetical protein [Tepidimonas charontis]|uniref:Uncharacterized protein n=1 Tax=Tepidimonas charontis TaxID=2267262 RepID=A0A554XER4_9BURK|nr:hypothetical protein [Tepidimonas charontis]TSE34338.1 hypothetical protein Tchar_01431 [Tepidimonas charontis]